MIRFKTCLAIVVAMLPLAAQAAPAGIDFTQALMGLDHKPLQDCKEPGKPDKDGKPTCDRMGPTTLGEIAAAALMVQDNAMSLPDQVRRKRLAERVLDGKSVSLTSGETKLIEDGLTKLNSPLYAADVVQIIDPALYAKGD